MSAIVEEKQTAIEALNRAGIRLDLPRFTETMLAKQNEKQLSLRVRGSDFVEPGHKNVSCLLTLKIGSRLARASAYRFLTPEEISDSEEHSATFRWLQNVLPTEDLVIHGRSTPDFQGYQLTYPVFRSSEEGHQPVGWGRSSLRVIRTEPSTAPSSSDPPPPPAAPVDPSASSPRVSSSSSPPPTQAASAPPLPQAAHIQPAAEAAAPPNPPQVPEPRGSRILPAVPRGPRVKTCRWKLMLAKHGKK